MNYSADELRRVRGLKTEAVRELFRGPRRKRCTATTSCWTVAAQGRSAARSVTGARPLRSLRLRSEYDREILALAVPALGALAAEPLYLLADTAMVGHLGTPELAALAIAGTLLTGAFTLFNFLTYGTTAHVARLHGAGEVEAAGRLAAQALWLSMAIGVALVALRPARRAAREPDGRRRAHRRPGHPLPADRVAGACPSP